MKNRVTKFKALSDECRLQVIELLFSGPRSVNQMVEDLKVRQNLLSHHLKILREAAIVETERRGNQVFYHLANNVKMDGKEFDFGCCRLEFRS